jgi:hypothetical protein
VNNAMNICIISAFNFRTGILDRVIFWETNILL